MNESEGLGFEKSFSDYLETETNMIEHSIKQCTQLLNTATPYGVSGSLRKKHDRVAPFCAVRYSTVVQLSW